MLWFVYKGQNGTRLSPRFLQKDFILGEIWSGQATQAASPFQTRNGE
jgi:hypothetical protein